MAFMLVTLAIFFVLVGLFVASYSINKLKSEREILAEKTATMLVSKLANSPEFSCEESFGYMMTNCIDLDKAMALKEFSNTYKKFWPVSNIEIRRIYPPENNGGICTKENYPDCGYIKIMQKDSSGFDQSTFVSLCKKELILGTIQQKCEVGKLIVRFAEDEKQ